MKKHSTALAIRERRMKITMKCHLTCIRMATTQKRRERKRMAGEGEGKGREGEDRMKDDRKGGSKGGKMENNNKDVEKLESLYTGDGNMKWCSPCGKRYGSCSENQKQ